MFENIWNRVREWFTDRQERNALLHSFNQSAREAFVTGVAPTLLKASLSKGNSAYHHRFSHWLYSGFRITAFTGKTLTKSELVTIGTVVLSDDALVRRLVVLGWDTLQVQADQGTMGCQWQLKDFLQLNQ